MSVGKFSTQRISVVSQLAVITLVAAGAVGRSAAATSTYSPYIVNGTVTSAYPATGALLMYDDSGASSLNGLCSGALIGCRTFLTAAHCVCSDRAFDAASCAAFGTTDPATLRVFLQGGGIFPVASVQISPDYDFAVSGDVAVVTLAEPVTGIAPSPINLSRRLDLGAAATIVGFGTTSAGRRVPDDAGIKRQGKVTTAECPSDIPSGAHLCWNFSGDQSNTCEGDSGGPLFADFGSGLVLAGVTSGGNSFDCLAPDIGFDSDVFVNRTWILAAAGADLGSESCSLPAVGGGTASSSTTAGQLSTAAPQSAVTFDVPAGTSVLRVALNAQLGSASGAGGGNDFDLYVRAGAAPTLETFDCSDRNATPFGFCEIKAPAAGTWHGLVDRIQGDGAFQLTATTFGSPVAPCGGDCDGDDAVTIDEILEGVLISLDAADLTVCPSFDANGDGQVTIEEVLSAVSSVLNGCPAA